jgi:hypothetical protein
MTQTFTEARFDGAEILASDRLFSGYRFERCRFNGCVMARADEDRYSLVVRDCVIEDCHASKCILDGVLFQHVVVDGLASAESQLLVGCVFDRVVLKGVIGSLITVPPNSDGDEYDARITEIASAYREVEWALDISEAYFASAALYLVPGHLVKYDHETQVLLRRESFVDVPDDILPMGVATWVSRFESTPFDSFVAVAPRRSKDFEDRLRDIQWLRDRNLAE